MKDFRMNENQKKVLIVIGAVVLGMLLFPPFHYVGSLQEVGGGYSFIFNPPYNAMIDIKTLFAQWIGVLIVGGIAVFLFKSEQ
jgi:hypothetical protein